MRLGTFITVVFPHLAALHLDAAVLDEHALTLKLSSTRRTACCPTCRRRSRRVHSRFVRRLADVPVACLTVRLEVHARRFRCLHPACPQQTFREPLPEVAPRYQRRTLALQRCLEAIRFALGGQAGKRLALQLHLGPTGVSRNTLLRIIRRAALASAAPMAPPLRVLGVDDFAFGRGTRYGAILVDLEAHRVIDLLPNREAATFAKWLRAHGGTSIAVVSRDRSGAFADGARQAAPQAVQVADRFHLLQNLGMALDRLLTREQRVLTRAAQTIPTVPLRRGSLTPADPPDGRDPCQPHATLPCIPARPAREHAAVEARRQARYERVVALQQEGRSLREIARQAGVCRNTVRRYLDAGTYVACAQHSRRIHVCDAYAPYLQERWEAGERNSAVLLTELRARGYTGGASTLRQYLAAWQPAPRRPGRRPAADGGAPAPPRRRAFSPRQTRWLLLRPVEELDDVERAYRTALCQESPAIATAQGLVAEFTRMVRERARDDLPGWLEEAERSAIPELVSFVHGVRHDEAAVAAALTSPHSQGQTEGQVTRLKLLKRQSYGRANFDLLRCQALSHAA